MMKNLVRASRPRTLIASVSPILMGTALAYGYGLSLWVFVFTLLTGIGIQVSTNFANDLYDFLKGADTEKRKGPVRVTASGLLTSIQMKLATFAVMGLTAVMGSVLIVRGGFLVGGLVALSLLFAYGYTAGPFPIAYLGLAEVFVLIFFGPVACGFTYYLQTLTYSSGAFLLGLAPGLISCSLLVVNNLRDRSEDLSANKRTLVARFGERFGKWEYALATMGGCLIPLFFTTKHPLVFLCLLCLIPGAFLVWEVFRIGNDLDYLPVLGRTGQLLTLQTFIFSLSYIL